MRPQDRADDDDIDYCFTRVSADQLARAILGDVRITPTAEQITAAQNILDVTGDLYRIVAGFRFEEWHKNTAER